VKLRYRLAAALGSLAAFVVGLYLAETHPHTGEPMGYVGVAPALAGVVGLIKALPS
jgi:hypothetical protein